MLPLSGRNGWMSFGGIDVPLYSWVINSSIDRLTYRTSNSSGYPRRTSGVLSEQIILRGVSHHSPFAIVYTTTDNYSNFLIGWNDFVAMDRKVIDVYAMLVNERIDINYFANAEPSHMWTTTLLGIINNKIIDDYPIIPHVDPVLCSYKKCDKVITTTDANLNAGFVKHVRRVSITHIIDRELYMTSNSNNHPVASTGFKDRLIELDVQGDFDYWFNGLSTVDTAFDYKFYYGPIVATDFWPADKMKIINMSNFVVNVKTGELLQATVHLGAAYP